MRRELKIKKIFVTFLSVLCVFCFTFFLLPKVSEAVVKADSEAVVFADGKNYTTLIAAAEALPAEGGTIVVSAPITHTATTNRLSEENPGQKLVITSVYNGVDYAETNGAYFGLGRILSMFGDVTFENIVIKQTYSETNAQLGAIYALGNVLTIGEGVTTEANATSGRYPLIYGGSTGNGTYDTSVNIASGTWYNVFGGSYSGTLTGNTSVIMTGGQIANLICGSNRLGTQNGNVTLDISGNSSAAYVTGGMHGSSSMSTGGGTINGDITLNIHGNAKISQVVSGAGYYNKTVANSDISINIYENARLSGALYGKRTGTVTARDKGIRVILSDNAYVGGNLYAGGYSTNAVTGDVYFEINDNATVKIAGTASSRGNKIDGDTTTVLNGGKIGHYGDGYGVIATGVSGSVTGTATIILDGTDVAGVITLGKATGEIILKSGKAGSVTSVANIDLTGNKTLSIGGTVEIDSLIGGGTLQLSSAANLNVSSISGNVDLQIVGQEPVSNQTYLTIAGKIGDEINYVAVDDETLEKVFDGENTTYTIKYAERFDEVDVRVNYWNPLGGTQPKIAIYNTAGDSLTLTKGTENGTPYAEITLLPGTYTIKVYYKAADDFIRKAILVTGKKETQVYDIAFEPYKENSYMETWMDHMTEEVVEQYLGTDDLVGYTGLDTPTFTKYADSEREFMHNEDVCEYVEYLDSLSTNLRVFYPFGLSELGNKTPVLVFTKDDIEGLTFEQAAKKIRDGGVRDIISVGAGIHGNEPAGMEGALAFAKELIGPYGDEVLSKVGAIIITPVIAVDNAQRFTRSTPEGVNPNRDYLQVKTEGVANILQVLNTFMPTVHIDVHEDGGRMEPDDNKTYYDYMADICVRHDEILNSPLKKGVLEGTYSIAEYEGYKMESGALDQLASKGFRVLPYAIGGATTATSGSKYPELIGTYGFIVETRRLWSGKVRYERSVFSVSEALKALTDQVVSYEGQLAQNSYKARKTLESRVDFDENFKMVQKGSDAQMPKTYLSPSVYYDGTWKNTTRLNKYSYAQTATKTRVMPTAYVIPTNLENIDRILYLLDVHAVEYTKIKPNSTLTLKKYDISTTINSSDELTAVSATIESDASEVTFPEGAYVVTLNQVTAYVAAYLFEPDGNSFSSETETPSSLVMQRLISQDEDLYRSEVNGISSLVSDMAVELETGDVDGDGEVTKDDAIYVLMNTFFPEDYPANQDFDFNGDGEVSKDDAIQILMHTFFPEDFPLE